MNNFDQAFAFTVGIEGKYSDNKADSGGRTMFGVTEAVARMNGYQGEMSEMPLSVAKQIYRSQYWDTLRLDDIAEVSPEIASELFDTAVNCGVSVAGRFLQRCLNAFNREGKDYPDVGQDGIIGPMTISALRLFKEKRSEEGIAVLIISLNCLQGARYIELAERRSKDEAFVYGWIKNRVI